jgi:MFS family permease
MEHDHQSEEETKLPHSPNDEEKSRNSISPQDDATLAVLELVKTHDAHHPIHWNPFLKWGIIIVYGFLQIFVTLTSTTYLSVEFLVQERFGGSTQVITLGQSMFIVGNAVGPAFLGPLSDIGGRKWVYVVSIFLYAVLNIVSQLQDSRESTIFIILITVYNQGCALALNLPMLVIFLFLCGAAGSTALSNYAGTIADLFGDADSAGQAMALFVASANIGPSLGSPVGEWIADNSNMGLNWVFWLNVIIGGAFSLILCLIPETLPRMVIGKAVKKSEAANPEEIAIAETKVNVLQEMRFIFTMALRIMVTEPIVIFLGIYNGFAYGLLFLYLDGVFDVFVLNNGLS